MDTLFISDLHLSEERPDKLALFEKLMRGPARKAAALYILGDLFENFWLGNDDATPPCQRVIAELTDFCQAGGTLYIIRGNRELVMEKGIEHLTGCTFLPDPSVIDLDGSQTLIMHGDVLCTRDVKYQRYRKFMELTVIKKLFLSFPYALRMLLVRGLRPVMKRSVRSKQADIIDVDQSSVATTMREHGVWELIHGHTHRPNTHEFQLDDKPARRMVLGDWYQHDSVLVCSNGDKRLMRVQDYINSNGSSAESVG